MTKIRVEEVIPQGEYIKRLIDEQGVDNLFVEQLTYLDDTTIMKLANLETKDDISFTNDGDKFIVQNEVEIDENVELRNILIKNYNKSDLVPFEKVDHYVDISISELLKRIDRNIVINEIYLLDRNFNTHLIWKDGEMV